MLFSFWVLAVMVSSFNKMTFVAYKGSRDADPGARRRDRGPEEVG